MNLKALSGISQVPIFGRKGKKAGNYGPSSKSARIGPVAGHGGTVNPRGCGLNTSSQLRPCSRRIRIFCPFMKWPCVTSVTLSLADLSYCGAAYNQRGF